MNELDLLDEIMEFIHKLYHDPKLFRVLTEEQLDRIGEFQDQYYQFKEMQERANEIHRRNR